MKSIPIPVPPRKNPAKKAVAPMKGAVVFFCSTGNKHLSRKKCFPAISQRQTKNRGENNNLLRETHCFRLALAKHPLALVIGVEGQIKAIAVIREVGA